MWPAARTLRARAGLALALRPIMKKVARTFSQASASSTRSVMPGMGPSSKVSTNSPSARGSGGGVGFQPDEEAALRADGQRAGGAEAVRAGSRRPGRPVRRRVAPPGRRGRIVW